AGEFWSGGGPLYSTARDYMQFLQMLLHGGAWNGARILRPETVALMGQNHTGNIPAGIMKTQAPAMSNDVDLFPGAPIRWGLGYMLNMQPGPNGRSAGTVSWGGIFNTYYWLDSSKRVTGLIMTQILPFADPRVLALYGRFESAVYETVRAACPALGDGVGAHRRPGAPRLVDRQRDGQHVAGGADVLGRRP